MSGALESAVVATTAKTRDPMSEFWKGRKSTLYSNMELLLVLMGE